MEDRLKEFVEQLLQFDTTAGNESAAQRWLKDRLESIGFETYEWEADEKRLAKHRSFPSDPEQISTTNRPSIGGVLEFGNPDEGPTVVLNGHIDVVPAERDHWVTNPFEPTTNSDRLIGRGAADMKSGLGACVFAAMGVANRANDIDGRIVVESVVGEEEGGIGAASAALSNPYPFDRDAVIIAEPTELTLVTAVEGSAMLELQLEGKSAHAATRWNGESVLPHFENIRKRLRELERERAATIDHELYSEFENPWPISIGRVDAGKWESSVAATLSAQLRVGVSPGETVADVERNVRDVIREVSVVDKWLAEHPPTVDRFSIQFESAEVSPDEPIVKALAQGMRRNDLDDTEPRGVTYGADSRHYQSAGIPTVLFGPGSIEQGHFPNESIDWNDVVTSKTVLEDAVLSYFQG